MLRKGSRVWAVVAVAAAFAAPAAQADYTSPHSASWSSDRPGASTWNGVRPGSAGWTGVRPHGVRPNPWMVGSVGALLGRADTRG
jgi:hypothetical protein